MTKRLLICYAHPDDESFGLGSVIGKYVADGVEVTLICATNGDVGTVAPEKLAGYASVADLRQAELDCAAQVLGLKEVIKFNYRDSGMMNGPENADPRSLWQAPLEEVTARVVEVIRRVRPQVVITFDPFGGYGHPDHIKCHRATLAAFEQLKGDPACPSKLYYHAFPRVWVRIGVSLMRLRGQDPRRAGTNHDMDFQAVLDATQPVHTRIYVGNYHEIGQRAAECHASQIGPRQTVDSAGRLPKRFSRWQSQFSEWMSRQLSAYADFSRVIPAVQPDQPLETDLFAGVAE
ncbi:MAG: PIG-L family deacetylase [Aggregatilineales bacterium]